MAFHRSRFHDRQDPHRRRRRRRHRRSRAARHRFSRDAPVLGVAECDGGHLVTVVSVKGNFGGDTIELTLADPGRAPDHGIGNYLETQSSYNRQKVTLKKVTFREYISSSSHETEMGGGGGALFRTVTRWEAVTAPADSTCQMVEGFSWFEARKTS